MVVLGIISSKMSYEKKFGMGDAFNTLQTQNEDNASNLPKLSQMISQLTPLTNI